ncbi:MFS transporter [Streptomyces sp. NPDC048278]|uniref:MFS transporter n=1 Tax=Streptomyces sp. NPDC048278 TaxID=3155809 RepID=UPI00342E35CA
MSSTSPASLSGRAAFTSLSVPNYRLFAVGGLISNSGTWMSRIAQDWLVLNITGSSFAVGVTTALQFLAMAALGLYGGLIADRYPKRRILLCTQTATAVLALTLAALTLSGHVRLWHVYVIAFLLGVATVVDNPARQAFVVEMVGRDHIRNAVSLNSASFQVARLVGPVLAGALIGAFGEGWAFLCNGLSFLAPLAGLLLMRTRDLHPIELAPRRKGQLREGLSYVAARPDLRWSLVLVGFIGTFGLNLPIWLSAFAHDVFHGDASAYGLFNTSTAVGSVTGALLAARRSTTGRRLLIGSATGFGLLEAAAALSPSRGVFLVLLAPVGLFALTFNTTVNVRLHIATDPAMRGRVMSMLMIVFVCGTPIGGPAAGWITDTYGARFGLLCGGLVTAGTAIGIGAVLARTAGLRLRPGLPRERTQRTDSTA